MFDFSSIMREAHRIARIYRAEVGYRKALVWGLKDAWKRERGLIEMRRFDAELAARQSPPAVVAIKAEILSIEMKDRMTLADFATVASLHSQLAHA